MTVQALPAFYGDSTLISWNDDGAVRNILVDGGPARTYPGVLSPLIKQLQEKKQFIDLLVITHIDHDHIGGIIKLFEDVSMDKSMIRDVWFNSGNRIAEYIAGTPAVERDIPLIFTDEKAMSFKEGNTFEKFIEKLSYNRKIICSPEVLSFLGATIHILSPNYSTLTQLHRNWQKEGFTDVKMSGKHSDHNIDIETLAKNKFIADDSVANGSSIGFLIKVNNSSLLMLADAFSLVVEENLRMLNFNENNKLKVDAVKVAHHGSRFNNGPSLYDLLDCKKFLVSTDGSRDHMPHKEALARIVTLHPGSTLYFNYEGPSKIMTGDEMKEYDFKCMYTDKLEL